jgi:hypothetical protein
MKEMSTGKFIECMIVFKNKEDET